MAITLSLLKVKKDDNLKFQTRQLICKNQKNFQAEPPPICSTATSLPPFRPSRQHWVTKKQLQTPGLSKFVGERTNAAMPFLQLNEVINDKWWYNGTYNGIYKIL
jgi:hypothetical protein